jgi:hypothetical protein
MVDIECYIMRKFLAYVHFRLESCLQRSDVAKENVYVYSYLFANNYKYLVVGFCYLIVRQPLYRKVTKHLEIYWVQYKCIIIQC